MNSTIKHVKNKSRDLVASVATRSKEVVPQFWGLKKTYRVVIGIILVVVLWMASGLLTHKPTNSTNSNAAVVVKVEDSIASKRSKTLILNGLTKASKSIEIKAQLDGNIESLPAVEGQFLRKGDIICKQDERGYNKALDQAQAEYNKQALVYKSTKALFDKGLSAQVQLADALAQLRNAETKLKNAQETYSQTIAKAPEDGFIDTIDVEEGDFASVIQNSRIATFLVLNPVQIITNIPERNISEARDIKTATVVFSGNSQKQANVKFLSRAADPDTRTYKLELTMPNEDYKIFSGQTVEVRVGLSEVLSHHVPRSAVVLDIKGDIAVKTVSSELKVRSYNITIIDEDEDGFWVTGLPETSKIITLGHQYVKEDELVVINDKVS